MLHSDAPKKALEAFVRWVMRGVAYHVSYGATIQSQDADGLVDVYPDDEAIRGNGLTKVPIRLGVPGTVQVPSGTRCRLRFENGDPSKPYVSEFGNGSLTMLLLGSGAQFLALANLVDARFTALENKVNSHISTYNTHTHPVPGVTTGGGATTSSVTASSVASLSPGASTASSKTKGE